MPSSLMTDSMNRIEAVRDLLLGAIPEVFGTMLNTGVEPMAPDECRASEEPRVAGSVGFMGEVNGIVYLQMTASFARMLAGRLLEMPEEEFEGEEMIDDAIGEISNMVVGAVKSRLCDEGLPCVLTIPTIVRGPGFSVAAAGYSERRSIGFRCGNDRLVVDLLMKPSGESPRS